MKLIISVVLFSYLALMGVGANTVGHLGYASESVDYQAAVLSGGLLPDGLELISDGKTASEGLKVTQNYGLQRTANVNVLEPKVSDAYLQWGN